MDYATTFCLRYVGTILSGPRAGRILDNDELGCLCIGGNHDLNEIDGFNADINNWIARANEDKPRFRGKIEVCSKQYQKRKGFVYKVLSTIECP